MRSPGLKTNKLDDASIEARNDKPSPSSSETECSSSSNKPQDVTDPQTSSVRTETSMAGQSEPYPAHPPQQPNTVGYGAQISPFHWSSSHSQRALFPQTNGTPQGVSYWPGRFDTVPGWPGGRPDVQTYQAGLNALVTTETATAPQAGANAASYLYLQKLNSQARKESAAGKIARPGRRGTLMCGRCRRQRRGRRVILL